MKFFILLLCLSMAFSKPVDQEDKNVTRQSDEVALYFKSLLSKFNYLYSKFAKDLRRAVKDDLAAQAVLSEFQKLEYLKDRKTFSESIVAKALMREAKKYDTLLAHFIEKNPVELMKDLAQEHPGVEPDLSDSPVVKSLIEDFWTNISMLVEEEKAWTHFDFRKQTLSEAIHDSEIPPDTEPQPADKFFSVLTSAHIPIPELIVESFLADLAIRKYYIDNGYLN